jgi:competence/damage-inducible protein cinA C-terminal domain
VTPAEAARDLLASAGRRGLTVAVAESLTGGMVSSALVGEPGASAVLVGAVVCYATRLKAQVLGVSQERLEATGPVDGEVARQMARGVARVLGADVGLATTGVAGPGPSGGHVPGEVYVAAWGPWGTVVDALRLEGDRLGRLGVRQASATAVLRLALAQIRALEKMETQDTT